MADDNTLRPYRSSDPYRRAAEPPRPSQEASARDPLAELARLLGQSDPFADLGRSNSRERQQDAHDAPATAPENWQGAPVREPQFAAGDTPRRSAQESSYASSYGSSYATSRDYAQPPASEPADWRAESRVYDEPEHGADQQSQHYDDQSQHYANDHTDGGQYDAQEAEYAYQDDVPLQPHEHEMYDDAPRARRGGGFATALALIGCAVLGLVIDAALGAPTRRLRGRGMSVIPARRIARPLARAARRIAGGKLRVAHRGALPVLRRGRRRVVRVLLPLARIASPEIGERIALPEQAGKLGQRIAGTCLLTRPRRLGRATIWITGAIGS